MQTSTIALPPNTVAATNEQGQKRQVLYFPGLDALRSIACMFVLSSHLVWEVLDVKAGSMPGWLYTILSFFFGNGGTGVRIFFCLSGFLITYLILLEVKQQGKLNLKNFYIRRVLRIWPVYYLVVLFVFVGVVAIKHITHHGSPIFEQPALSALFLNNFDDIRILNQNNATGMNPVLGVTWSVSIEEQFYLFWPVLFALLPVRLYKFVFPVMIAGAVIYSCVSAESMQALYFNTVPNLIFLASGGLMAYLMVNYKHVMEKRLYFSKAVWAVLLLAGLAGVMYLGNLSASRVWGVLTYYLFGAAFICFFIFNQTANVAKPLVLANSKLLVKIGKYTYGLYMYHRIIYYLLDIAFRKAFKMGELDAKSLPLPTKLLFIALSLAGAYVMSYLSYQYVEKRFLKLKDKFSIFHKFAANKVA